MSLSSQVNLTFQLYFQCTDLRKKKTCSVFHFLKKSSLLNTSSRLLSFKNSLNKSQPIMSQYTIDLLLSALLSVISNQIYRFLVSLKLRASNKYAGYRYLPNCVHQPNIQVIGITQIAHIKQINRLLVSPRLRTSNQKIAL